MKKLMITKSEWYLSRVVVGLFISIVAGLIIMLLVCMTNVGLIIEQDWINWVILGIVIVIACWIGWNRSAPTVKEMNEFANPFRKIVYIHEESI